METYEQKYKSLVGKIKRAYMNALTNSTKAVLEEIFPELAENRDEKIRKELLESFKYQQIESRTDKEWLNGIKLSEVVAWLEKQSNTIPDECVFRPVAGCDIESAAKQAIKQQGVLAKKIVLAFNGAYIPVGGKAADIIVNEYNSWLEKQGQKKCIDDLTQQEAMDIAVAKCFEQGEQKPVIKMKTPEESLGIDSETYNEIVNDCIFGENEPKFKVGDWIISKDRGVHEDYRICRICRVDNDRYYIENGDFLDKRTVCDYEYKLWTIQDARDGDVLVKMIKHIQQQKNSVILYLQK